MDNIFCATTARSRKRTLAARLCFGVGIGAGCLTALLPHGASASTYTNIYTFKAGIADGVEAGGPLLPTADGSIYGVTQYGGTVAATVPCNMTCGTVFKLTPIAGK